MKITISFLLILLVPVVCGQQLTVHVNESGKVTSYFDEYWVVQVQGNITIINPINQSFDYFLIPYQLGTLAVFEGNGTNHIKPNSILVPYITPNDVITMQYEIRGISAYDPLKHNQGVFGSAFVIDSMNLNSFLISRILKSDIENATITTGNVRSINGRRLVSVTLENPSTLTQNISIVRVIKTPEQDPNTQLEEWTFGDDGEILIPPMKKWLKDIVDYNATEGEVYWLSTEARMPLASIQVKYNSLTKNFNQEDVYEILNNTLTEYSNERNITTYLEYIMYLKKSVSQSVMYPNDIVTVRIQLNNFAPIRRKYNLTEIIPVGFVLYGNGSANQTDSNKLSWVSYIGADSSDLITYQLKFVDNSTYGLDFFEPGVLKYANETLTSARIPFIRQEIPDKKVFIQKNIRYSTNDEIVVTLKVQNLGGADLKDIYVVEYLGANDVFREISKQFVSKGRWEIPLIKKDEVWEVTYVTNDNPNVNQLPDVYGIDKKVVLKTLVFEHTITNEWIVGSLRFIQIFGPVFILGFIMFFFVYHRRVNLGKTRGIKSLGRTIRKLRKKTDLDPQEKINFLKNESREGIDIEDVGMPDVEMLAGSKSDPSSVAKENLEKLKHIDEDSKPKK